MMAVVNYGTEVSEVGSSSQVEGVENSHDRVDLGRVSHILYALAN